MTTRRRAPAMPSDPEWYRDAVIYELHVRAFADSDGDGIGDFRGLTSRLDYLQDLGVTALWLLPFYPSPLKDDGYDISDYRSIHPAYGTMADFREFLNEAHRRQIRVITELVINHTSDQHPWFQRARRAPVGSRHRDYYVWSGDTSRYGETRIIFKDFEPSNWTHDPMAGSSYWHRFFHHQPDLNFDNPAVRVEVLRLVDYWLSMGVDGLRLDAVPYLYERDGTNCENLPETHEFLRLIRAHVDANYKDRMVLAEANQWPEDAVEYFGNGDECHMAFHFPVMPRLFMAIQMEDRFPIVDILRQTPDIPEGCQWAMFLRNHDELTLEMVTDEERDYMYRAYASDPQARINLGIRRRLAPLLGNDPRKIQLMNGLLLSMPGTPIIYYGDEIGMGDNVYLGDRNGVRTPMQWSADRNAGFSRANPQRLYSPVVIDPGYHYEAVNVESQQANHHLLLWWMKRLIALRKQYRVFGKGSLEFLYPENPKVISFVRSHEDQTVLVVANLSRYAQAATMDLSAHAGTTPVELFGQSEFPPIGESPYTITLGPHDFFWFSLQRATTVAAPAPTAELPVLDAPRGWVSLLGQRGRGTFASTLLANATPKRWFGGKSRRVVGAEVAEAVELPAGDTEAFLILLRVNYRDGEPDVYAIPVALASGHAASAIVESSPEAIIGRVHLGPRRGEGVLYDAMSDAAFVEGLLRTISGRRTSRSGAASVSGMRTTAFRDLRGAPSQRLVPTPMGAEQSNTSVLLGERLVLKLFRRPGEGVNPDLEIGRMLTEQAAFAPTARVAGAVEYRPRRMAEPTTIAILQEYVENEGDAWRYTLGLLGPFFERALALPEVIDPPNARLLDLMPDDLPEDVEDAIGGYLWAASLLGRRTAELHQALGGADATATGFAPEPVTALYQRSLYAGLRSHGAQALHLIGQRARRLPEEEQKLAATLLAREPDILQRFSRLQGQRLGGMRTRVHGDFHLGQVLYTGNDFVIIDFEGEPARAITERRLKRSPLRDVAGMIRSFDYAAHAALREGASTVIRTEDLPALERWADTWTAWVSATYLRSYLDSMEGSPLLPQDEEGVGILLDAFLLEKALYEITYELNNRPNWISVPLAGTLRLLDQMP